MVQNTKSSEMLVTRKLPKTKSHQMIKSKTKVKDTSENTNRKKAGARGQILLSDQNKKKKLKKTIIKKKPQGLKHTG